MGLVWGLMTTGMNAIIFWMPLILDATLNSDEALAAANAKARGLERAAETSGHHDQRVRTPPQDVVCHAISCHAGGTAPSIVEQSLLEDGPPCLQTTLALTLSSRWPTAFGSYSTFAMLLLGCTLSLVSAGGPPLSDPLRGGICGHGREREVVEARQRAPDAHLPASRLGRRRPHVHTPPAAESSPLRL